MLIPSNMRLYAAIIASLSRRVNANSQLVAGLTAGQGKLIKKGEC